MKLRHSLLLTLLVLAAVPAAWAQGRVSGKVFDKKSGAAIAYASVTLHKTSDTALVNGAVTTDNGSFSIDKVPYGSYLLRVSFMGYETYNHPTPVRLSASAPTVNTGRISIAPTAATLESVEITAERTMVEYQLDKRVINVDKNIVTGGGTATDVLENVPSVAIDNDGNVTLRGSTNVKVLIDGRPYELLGSDLETLLEQIPASTVENVEVITNPSAKYDPEGMSGIINLKLKDRSAGALGLNGVANLNVGAPLPFMIPDNLPHFIPTTMGSLNLNYATPKWNFTFSADGGNRSRAGISTSRIDRRTINTSDSLNESNIHNNRMGSVKLGAEYFINDKNSILLSYQLRGGNRHHSSIVDNMDIYPDAELLDYCQSDTSDNHNRNHTVNLNYTKKFDQKDRLLTLDVTFNHRNRWGDGRQQQLYDDTTANFAHYYLRETSVDNHNNNGNILLNYVHPLGEKSRLEAGYEGRILEADQSYTYDMTEYDLLHNLHSYRDSAASMHYIYSQQVHAIYATFATQLSDKLSLQAGLRGEYSNVRGGRKNTDTPDIDKPYYQLYPTLHLSYTINKDQSFQLSYSRRVRRPHMWDLHPYIDVREGQQLSFGNPSIDPEFTNAFELSYNLGFKQTNIFSSLYFRQTNNMMTRYGFVWDSANVGYYSPWVSYNSEYDGYWASTWQNLNQGINCGLEVIVDQQVNKWWKLNLSVNLYESYIQGTELLGNSDKNAFRVSGKLNSYMTLPQDWTIQFSGQYRAPFMDLQTDMAASYWADLAVKKDILQRRATVNLRIGDVFCTGGFGHTTDNAQLYRVFRARRISPTVTIGFSYKINNGLKQKPQQPDAEDESSEMTY